MAKLQAAILQTLAYADIFDYPLLTPEVWRFLIGKRKSDLDTVQKELSRMSADSELIDADREFYFLKGRKEIVSLRKKREKWSQKKMEIARRTAGWLKLIPTIKMVAVTGALAMENSEERDDIDLLIVTSRDRLWLTRLLTVALVELVARRRRPEDKEVKDKICLNMFLDEKHLAMPKKERDLFSAHEVCQLKPLWEKENCYQKFIEANRWTKNYLPNWKENTSEVKPRHHLEDTSEVEPGRRLGGGTMDKLEILAMKPQLRYMAKRKTSEITEPGRIRFHPQDAREWILKEYQKRLKELDLA